MMGDRDFELSTVISRGFEVIGRNFALFIGMAVLIVGIPTFLVTLWQFTAMGMGMNMGLGGFSSPGFMTQYFLTVGVSLLVNLVVNAILSAGITRATAVSLSGGTPSFAESVSIGLRLFLPLIVIAIVMTLSMIVIGVVLVVPVAFLAGMSGLFPLVFVGAIAAGVVITMIYTAWSVTVQSYVQERIGIFASFGRSGELTRGVRWKIFGIILIVSIGMWILGIAVAAVLMAMQSLATMVWFSALANTITGTLGSMVMVAMQTSIYVELRDVKEGVAPNELEAIFA
jgi:hypothetical protein